MENLVILYEDEELIEELNNMCLGAHNVQLGTFLASLQEAIGKSTTIEWEEF